MPKKVKSKAQWRLFFTIFPKKKAEEMVKGVKYKSLPERIKNGKRKRRKR